MTFTILEPLCKVLCNVITFQMTHLSPFRANTVSKEQRSSILLDSLGVTVPSIFLHTFLVKPPFLKHFHPSHIKHQIFTLQKKCSCNHSPCKPSFSYWWNKNRHSFNLKVNEEKLVLNILITHLCELWYIFPLK